ncbi:hypothetical protein BN14_06988 [Rhizoctonia solani AG-1 IB]|uniref:Uncharacterized protein n=1 Tax=Thanatephorus cucumeris (strain AG1-IB / isolate 7/3/14) TaxID=1108050 RepID=M5C0K3_THACB|nr:hypothetical protein BN14_06988 [Rhizoctonia solani AG-1 IB]
MFVINLGCSCKRRTSNKPGSDRDSTSASTTGKQISSTRLWDWLLGETSSLNKASGFNKTNCKARNYPPSNALLPLLVPSFYPPVSYSPHFSMRYMKKPKGTVGRKGKYGWPQPLKDIFGITPVEYQFVFSIIKRLVFKKLDTTLSLSDQEGDNISWVIQKTYKFIPEFKIYRGDWPIQAFIQSMLKNANYQHQKLVRRLEASQDDPLSTRAATNNNEMTDAIDAANRVVDADSSDNEDLTKEAEYDTSMVSAANMTFGGTGTTRPFESHKTNNAYNTLDSNEESNNFLRNLLPPAISAPLLTRALDHSPSYEPDPLQVQQPKPQMRPPPEAHAPGPVFKSHSQPAAAAPTKEEPEPLPKPVPVPVSAASPMPSPIPSLSPSPSPSPEPCPKPAKQGRRNVRATAPTTSKPYTTRVKTSTQSEPGPNPTPKSVKLVKGKGRSRKVPQPEPGSERNPESKSKPKPKPESEPEPEPAPKQSRKTKVGTRAGAEPAPPASLLAASAHSKTRKGRSATKEKPAPRPKQACELKGLGASSSRQVKVTENAPESESEQSNMSASKSNPPESLSGSGDEEECETEEESQPVATIAKRNSKKLMHIFATDKFKATIDQEESTLTE